MRKNTEVRPLDRAPCSLIVWFLEVSFFGFFSSLLLEEGARASRGCGELKSVLSQDGVLGGPLSSWCARFLRMEGWGGGPESEPAFKVRAGNGADERVSSGKLRKTEMV